MGRALTGCPEVTFVAATTGSVSLVVSVVCRDTARLYRFVTEGLGPLDGITDVEITPALRIFKQAQTLLHTDRVTLVSPAGRG